MSKWDSVSPGKPVLEKLDRDIAAWKAYRRRQRVHYMAITLVILALCLLFALFDVRVPR
jgi:hypothetical protein